MTTKSRLLLFIALMVTATASAQLPTYSSFGAGGAYQNAATGITTNPFAVRFTASLAGSLDSVRLALLLPENPESLTTLDLSLIKDDGGMPTGSVLESWAGITLSGSSGARTIASLDHPPIAADVSYWLIATTPDPFLGWYTGYELGDAAAYNPYAEIWNSAFETTLPAFSASVIPTAVPEPSSYGIVIVASLAGLLISRRRWRLSRRNSYR